MAVKIIKYHPQATFNGIARVAILEAQLCGLNSNGTVEVADASATHGATATNRAWGFAVKAAAAGAMVALAPVCTVDGSAALTTGGIQYLGAAGAMTQTKNITNTQTQQIVGVARTSTESLCHITAPLLFQTAGNSTVASI